MTAEPPRFFNPVIRPAGLTGVLVSFGDTLSEPANRAALAFSAAVARAGIDGVEESAPSLVSVFVQFDPLHLDLEVLVARLTALLEDQASARVCSKIFSQRL